MHSHELEYINRISWIQKSSLYKLEQNEIQSLIGEVNAAAKLFESNHAN